MDSNLLLHALYPSGTGSVDCEGGNASNGGDIGDGECSTCPGDQVECCDPYSCKGKPKSEKCKW